ncbi:MAG: DUF411 domain-containing protein [Candidatus Paceibacterota bacterium]
MNTNIAVVLGIFIAIVGVGVFLATGGQVDDEVLAIRESVGEIVIYKSPTCGCCGVYASYMRNLGYDVRIEDTDDLSVIKRGFGIPSSVESCHTTEVAGYIIEGHVPEEAIQKLLVEQPDIKGIGMGGMPSGSPGMPGPQTEDFVIYEITHEGRVGDVFITL